MIISDHHLSITRSKKKKKKLKIRCLNLGSSDHVTKSENHESCGKDENSFFLLLSTQATQSHGVADVPASGTSRYMISYMIS